MPVSPVTPRPRLIPAALLSLMLALPASAEQGGPADVITQQFDAFRMGDFEGAFSHASPQLQQLFGSPDRFGAMVSHGYSMVLSPDRTRMLDLRIDGATAVQRVEVIDRKGMVHILDYFLIQGENGWKINAVTIVTAPPVAA